MDSRGQHEEFKRNTQMNKTTNNRNRTNRAWVSVLGASAILLAACGASTNDKAAIPSPVVVQTEVTPLESPLEKAAAAVVAATVPSLASPLESPLAVNMKQGLAGIDRVTLSVDAAAPQTVAAKVKGYLGDACTQLGAVTQVRDGNTVRVTVGTLRPADRMCAQVVKDFEVDVAVDAAGLAAGEYVVDVNGVAAKFEIDANGPKVP
jgi:hypothetical protein